MTVLGQIRTWWNARKPLSLDKCLAVEFNAEGVRVHVLQRVSENLEQAFSLGRNRKSVFQGWRDI